MNCNTTHYRANSSSVPGDPTWRQESWDANDTVLIADPRTDADVGDFFRRLPTADYLPTWHARRAGGARGAEEKAAAERTAVHAATPTVAHLDPLGRTFLAVAHNRFKYTDAPPNAPPAEEPQSTRVVLDIEGNPRELLDAENRVVMRYDYRIAGPEEDDKTDGAGNRIHQTSMEAGERWTLNDVAGHPLYAWDSRGQRFRTAYDPLRRPTDSFLLEGTGAELLVGRTVYGETQPNPEANNLRGEAVSLFDQAGVVHSDAYDFKGNLLHGRRRLAADYKTTLDWSAVVPLEAATYTSATLYDALNRPSELTAPDGSIVRPGYNEASLLERVEVTPRGETAATPFVTDIDYDAKGQRTLIDYGNGVRTTCAYDPLTFRLVRLLTRRDASAFPGDCPQPHPDGWPGCQLQNLHYTYDPVGNITHIGDDAQQTVYFGNRRVEPNAVYNYDSLYRLIEANGREHLGQVGGQTGSPTPPDALNAFHARLSHPGDGHAMGTYVERYVYDSVGNILSMQHRGSAPSQPGWTRAYAYNEASQLEPGKVSNRLSSTTIGTTDETYQYDGAAGLHGNITAMPHLPLMLWDYRDQLRATSRQVVNNGTPETTWYVYDSGGRRVRKVTERQAAAGQTPTRRKERIYLGGFEIYREYENDGDTLRLERETLHVMDDQQRIALVETRTEGHDPAPARLIRYQLGNHLGSASLELDEQAQIISYEEYYPYGSTSYQAVRSQTEAPKRYRYCRKERDDESGLDYFGARYYAPWLARWLSVDPLAEERIQWTPYVYVRDNPIVNQDPTGSLDCSVHGDGDGHIKYGDCLDAIHTWFARKFNKGFSKKFDQWRSDPKGRYLISRDKDATDKLVDAKPVVEMLGDKEKIYNKGTGIEHKRYDVKYRTLDINIKLPPKIHIDWKNLFHNLGKFFDKFSRRYPITIAFSFKDFKNLKHIFSGWGLTFSIGKGGGALAFGVGDWKHYNMFGLPRFRNYTLGQIAENHDPAFSSPLLKKHWRGGAFIRFGQAIDKSKLPRIFNRHKRYKWF